MATTTSDRYGRGVGFPLKIDAAGGIAETSGPAKIEDAIRIILGTQQGERVMRPTFGANLKRLVFAPNNIATANLAKHYVEDALERWEPRIDLLEVLVDNDNRAGALLINVHYRIRATQDVQSMVYPFYLEQTPR